MPSKRDDKKFMAKHIFMKVQERNATGFFDSHTRSKTMEHVFNHLKKIIFNLEFYAEPRSQSSVRVKYIHF